MYKNVDVVCVGVMVADVLAPGVDQSIFQREMTRVPLKFSTGGDAFNQAINISSMGYKVALCGKVGADSVGNFLVSEAKSHNIDTSLVSIDKDHQTSVTIVLINNNGERNFIGTSNGTNGFLTSRDINTSIFQSAKIVSIGSIYGSVSFTGNEISEILKEAKKMNCVTVADMMHADRGSLEDAKKALKFVDFFLPNLEEAKGLTGKTDVEDISNTLFDIGVGCVIIKLGKKGCFLKSRKLNIDSQYIDAFEVQNVVDTTGAGDALVSGFISGIIDGCNIADAVKRGCAAGHIIVQSVGATGGITSKNQIMEIVNKRDVNFTHI